MGQIRGGVDERGTDQVRRLETVVANEAKTLRQAWERYSAKGSVITLKSDTRNKPRFAGRLIEHGRKKVISPVSGSRMILV